MLLSVHVTSVLFWVRFNNFAPTMNFYWSYKLLLKSLILMRLPKGAASTKLSDHLLKGFTTTYVAECLLAKPFTLQEKKRFVPIQLPTCTSGSICKQERVGRKETDISTVGSCQTTGITVKGCMCMVAHSNRKPCCHRYKRAHFLGGLTWVIKSWVARHWTLNIPWPPFTQEHLNLLTHVHSSPSHNFQTLFMLVSLENHDLEGNFLGVGFGLHNGIKPRVFSTSFQFPPHHSQIPSCRQGR